jgi:hypothetical protein
VAGSCECGDEPGGSGATELVIRGRFWNFTLCAKRTCLGSVYLITKRQVSHIRSVEPRQFPYSSKRLRNPHTEVVLDLCSA